MASIETTRAVVEADETYDGKIIPTVQAELSRPVRVRDGATVQGSVYGETVETHPDSNIEGSVMASEAVEMEGGRVHGELGTPGKVVAEGARIDGTVTGKRVRLTDCVVRGNVVGADVILENSTVVGIATADRSLTVEDSLCYTFRGHGETTLANTTTVLPQAICDGDVTLETPVSVAGLGRLDVQNGESEADNDSDGGGRLPAMTDADLYETGETTYLTLAPRVLNLEKVTDRLDELERGVMDTVDDTSGEATASVTDLLSMLDIDAEVAE